MKKISNSVLLAGLICPYEEVREAYIIFALQKWLTSKNYGPKNWKQVKDLQELLPENLSEYLQGKIETFLPKIIAKTKGIDFSKVDWLLQDELHLGKDFSFSIAYATLINLDTYPNAGLNRVPKARLVEKMQKKLNEIDNMEVWGSLFSLDKLSPSGLDAFSVWAQKQEKESCLDNSVVRILCEKAKIQACFAKQIFEIGLYLICNFRGFMNETVVILDDFCSCYPMFRKPLENFLLKNFYRYFWGLEPFPYRNPLQYYKDMMEHLTSRKLHFPLSWKMKIVQKMLNQSENREIVIYLLDNLKAIYGCQIEDVDDAYFKAIKTGLKKKFVDADDVLEIVCIFAKGSLFRRENWWKNFAKYPLAWQKTMVMVYSSSKLSDRCLANAYFSLVRMNKENPWLFDDFEKLVSCFLAKKWNVSKQEVRRFFDVFADMSYAETTASYIQRGFLKLLQLADDEQIRSLQVLKNRFPDYACVFDCAEFSEKLNELEAKDDEKRRKELEDWKEIDRLLSKLQ